MDGRFEVMPITRIDAEQQRYAVLFFRFSTGAWYRPCFKDGDHEKCLDITNALNARLADTQEG